MIGITGYGAYIPRLRLERKAIAEANSWFNPALGGLARGARAICNWDEDSLTMAVAAARDLLDCERPSDIDAIWLASTTLPFEDRSNTSVLALALNIGEGVSTLDVGGTLRAGTSALLSALQSRQGRSDSGKLLLVAAEKRLAKAGAVLEMTSGDGAAALLVGSGNVLAEFVGAKQLAVDFVDHYRGQNQRFDYGWEERWIRDQGYLEIVPRAVVPLLTEHGIAASAIDHFIIAAPMRGVAESLAKALRIRPDAIRDNLQGVMGDCGAAHPLVMLANALETAAAGQILLVAGFGNGCDALLFRVTDAIRTFRPRVGVSGHLAAGRPTANYTRYLAFNGLIEHDRGLRSEVDKQTALTALYRNRDMLTGFVGGRCERCGTAQFPRGRICVNPNCGAIDSQQPHAMAETAATVQSWTADNLTYCPDPPQHFGMIVFSSGGRLMADITDVDRGEVAVGMPVRMEFRIKDFDDRRHFTRYFWKATPNRRDARREQ